MTEKIYYPIFTTLFVRNVSKQFRFIIYPSLIALSTALYRTWVCWCDCRMKQFPLYATAKVGGLKKKKGAGTKGHLFCTRNKCVNISCVRRPVVRSFGPDVQLIHLRAMCPAVGFAGRPARFLLRPRTIRQVRPYRETPRGEIRLPVARNVVLVRKHVHGLTAYT